MRGQAQAHSSVKHATEGARDDWRTPQELLGRVRRLGQIGLDACGNADNSTNARIVYSGPDGNGLDGLALPWTTGVLRPGELVYANYPYSDAMPWARKWTTEAATGAPVVVLGPARPDTKWHRLAVNAPSCSALAFWRGRITFEMPPGIDIYKITDASTTAADLAVVPGVRLAKAKPTYIYVEAEISLMDTYLACGLEGRRVGPAPAPFASCLYFYGLPISRVVDVFQDKADVYRPPERNTPF